MELAKIKKAITKEKPKAYLVRTMHVTSYYKTTLKDFGTIEFLVPSSEIGLTKTITEATSLKDHMILI